MIKIENRCCNCAVPSYPCLGKDCGLRYYKAQYCDICKNETNDLLKINNMELCINCAKELEDDYENTGIY